MKKAIIIIGLLVLATFLYIYAECKYYDPEYIQENSKEEVKELAENDQIKNGDLIFQTSLSGQSKAIQIATKSKYSHCGIIYIDNGRFYVFEAIQPVKKNAS